MGKREMDDEQRKRMHDLKRLTWRGVLTGGMSDSFGEAVPGGDRAPG